MAVKNFMTYHVAEVRPGARMNLILGPNGSGKSSLVCAIVLALGGSPVVRSVCVGTMAHRALASVRCWWERLSRCELGRGRCLGAMACVDAAQRVVRVWGVSICFSFSVQPPGYGLRYSCIYD